MIGIIEQIYETRMVTNGSESYSALNQAGLPTFMDRDEGELLSRVIREVRPAVSLEVGCAYGVSTLYICEALSAIGQPARHLVLDPFQRTKWHDVGRHNIEVAGYGHLVEFVEARSEFALPQLLSEGVRLDFALIDGLHTFEQCMVEFFYIDRMLNVGGVIAFDDADWKGINRVIRAALSCGNYRPVHESDAASQPRSPLGALRRGLRHIPYAGQLIRADVLFKPWDLGIDGTCVVLKKTAEAERGNGWYRDF